MQRETVPRLWVASQGRSLVSRVLVGPAAFGGGAVSLSAIRHGLRGLRAWFRFAWGWRDYDWSFAYEAYFLSVRHLRDHVVAHQMHVGWESDVAEMDEALRLWAAYQKSETEADWSALHDHLKAHARGWWC